VKRCGAMGGVAARLDLRISERHMAVRTAFLVLGGGVVSNYLHGF